MALGFTCGMTFYKCEMAHSFVERVFFYTSRRECSEECMQECSEE